MNDLAHRACINSGNFTLFRERYEELRVGALEPTSGLGGRRHGLSLLLDHGMVSWMQAWSNLTPTHTPESTAASAKVHSIPFSDSSFKDQLASLLATLALEVNQHTNEVYTPC